MLRRLLGASLLLGLLLAVPAEGLFAQKAKKKDGKKEAPPPADSSKLGSGDFAGLLKSVPGTDRLFTLEFDQITLVPSGKGGRGGKGPGGNAGRVIQLQRQIGTAQTQLRTARTYQQRVQASNRLAQLSRQLQQAVAQLQRGGAGAPAGFKYKTTKQEIEFQLREDVKVRSMFLTEQFDEKGNPKKMTKAELAAARGKDKHLPGYESSLEKLEVGQRVRLTLGPAPAKKAAPGAKDVEEKDGEKKMQVKLIVQLAEASKDALPPRGKGK